MLKTFIFFSYFSYVKSLYIELFLYLQTKQTNINLMKNLKKISRDELKSVLGGVGGYKPPYCKPGYLMVCESIGVCAEEYEQYDCICHCIPVTRP